MKRTGFNISYRVYVYGGHCQIRNRRVAYLVEILYIFSNYSVCNSMRHYIFSVTFGFLK